MKNNMKNNIVLIVVSTIVFISVAISAAYAYFVSGSINTSNKTGVVTTMPNKMATFMSYSTDPLELSITSYDLLTTSIDPAVEDTGTIYVTLASPTNTDTVYCTYNIDYVWDSEEQYVTPSMVATETYPFEISILGNQVITGDTSGHVYENVNLSEINLTDLTWTGEEGTIGRHARLVSDAVIYSNSTSVTTALWTFKMRFYCLPSSQNNLTGKTLNGHLVINDVMC